MKRKLLPLLIAGLASGYATAGVTVYGKLNVTMNSYDQEKLSVGSSAEEKDNWELESNASRIGVKGSEKLTDDLKAVYKMEFETQVDDGSDVFKQRNIYVGLSSKTMGTIIAGKNDTPVKLIGKTADEFNDLPLGDIKNFLVGENREDNIIIYTTPSSLGAFSASIAIMAGEDEGTDAAEAAGDDDNGIADKTSIVIQYKENGLSLALGQDKNVQGTDLTRFVAQYMGSGWHINALWQDAEAHDSENLVGKLSGFPSDLSGWAFDEQTAYVLSGAVKIADNTKLKVQYGMSESENSDTKDSLDTTQLSFGIEQKLSKKTKVFAYYTTIEGEANAGTGTITGDDNAKDQTFAVGMETKF